MHSPLRIHASLLGVVLLLGGLLSFSAGRADETDRPVALEETVKQFYQPLIDHQWAQGIVVGVVNEEGTHVYGFGRKGADQPEPPDGETLFEIGSVTKVFTGILLADMVKRGLVSLDDPVNQLLPEEIEPLKSGPREMRLVDLATHSSGLPRLPTNFAPADAADPYADYTVDKLHEFLKQHAKPSLAKTFEKLLTGKGPPAWAYSNVGVGLLGHLLERKADKSYEDLVLERICHPLEMNSTRVTLDEPLKARLIQGHDGEGNPTKPWALGSLTAAGGLRSSAADMLKFVAANLELRETPLAAAMRMSHVPRLKVNEKLEMGLNWFLVKPDWIYHSGMTGGYNSVVLLSKSKKIGLVVLADTAIVGQGELLDRTSFVFLQAVIDGKPDTPPPVRATAKVDPAVLDKYVGSYSLVPLLATFTVTREEDRLYAQLTGQGRCRLYPESETKFFYKAVDAQITFEREEDGEVARLVLHQGGKDLPAGRMKEATK